MHGETQLGTALAETQLPLPQKKGSFSAYLVLWYYLLHGSPTFVQDLEVGTNMLRTLEREKGKAKGLITCPLLPKCNCDFTCEKEWLILKLALWGLHIVVASSDNFRQK